MRTRTLLVYWLVAPLVVAAYIVGMATMADSKHDEERGPRAYASPHGNAWGFGHGKGQPFKAP